MYYIVNQHDQIVAMDPLLLSRIGSSDSSDFYQKLALGKLSLKIEGDTLHIRGEGVHTSFLTTSIPMSGILGELTLIRIQSETDDIHADDLLVNTSPTAHESLTKDEKTPASDDKEPLFSLKEETDEQTDKEEDEHELLDLLLPSDADNTIEAIEEPPVTASSDTVTSRTKDHELIYIDVEEVSERIGVSQEDYTLFFDEYIDTALSLEEALKSQDETRQNEAIERLDHLANVLQLPETKEKITQLRGSAPGENEAHIKAFFETLSRLSTAKPVSEATITETTQETESEKTAPKYLLPPIDLSDVKPIHFDFRMKEASKDLNLPVELIEEFIDDFITQAHNETKKMLEAYQEGDLGAVQKIGHLLKGTSSNLRITPLSNTLYEIQFNEDIKRVPELVRNYWGHFLSLENQIKLMKNK